MEKALIGLRYLRNIDDVLNDSFANKENYKAVTREIVYDFYDFYSIGLDDVYDELFECYEYVILGGYKSLLETVVYRLPKEFEYREIDDLAEFFANEYNRYFKSSETRVKELNDLLQNYEKDKKSIVITTTEEMLENGEYDRDQEIEANFTQAYQEKIDSLSGYGKKFVDLNYKIWEMNHRSISDIFEKVEELYRLVELKLNDISQPEDVFVDSSVPWIVYTVFNEFDLIQEIEKDKFEEEIKYRNRKYTFKGKKRKKKILARAIYLFSEFVQSEYQEKWQNRMATHFDIKSYPKLKNKSYDNEKVFRQLEKRIAPFKSLLD